ncbi:MAG: hypothetical protein GC201_12125 [Alphaproteobacteria bacterium]|nr:hypothetical protein [Alphaproteobacteria bacterium]
MAEDTGKTRRVPPLVWIPAAILGVVLGLLLIAYVLVRAGAFDGMIAGIVEDALSDPATDTVAKVEGLKGDPLSHFTVDRLVYAQQGQTVADLRGLSVDWSHLGLLAGKVRIDRLHADSLALAQPPPSQQKSTGPLIPNLPVDLRLERLKVDTVRFEGEETPFTLLGAGRWSGGPAIEIRLALAPQDAQGEFARLALDYDKPRGQLTLDGKLKAKAGGGLGNFLFPGEKADIALTLSGKGPIDNWHGSLEGSRGGDRIADLNIAVTDRVRIAGTIDPRPFLAKNQTTALIGEPAVTIVVGLKDGMPADYDATLLNKGAELRIQGSLEDREAMMSPSFAIRSRNAAWFAPLLGDWRYDQVTVDGRAKAGGDGRTVTADVRIDGLSGPKLTASRLGGAVTLTQAGSGAPFGIKGSGAAEGVKTGARTLRADWSVDGSYDPDKGRIRIASAKLSDDGSRIAADGTVSLHPLAIDGNVSVVAADLGQWTQAAKSGRIEASAKVQWRPDSGRLLVRADGKGSGLALADPKLAGLVGASPSFQLTMDDPAGSGTGDLKGSLDGAQVTARIDGRIGETVDAAFQARFADAAALTGGSLETAGPLELHGTLKGETSSPDVTLQTSLKSAAVSGLQFSDLSLSADVKDVAGAAHGEAQAAAVMDGEKVQARIPFEMDENGHWTADPITVSGATIDLKGRLEAAGLGAPISGKLTGKVSGKALLTALAGMPAAGDVDLDVDLKPVDDAQGVTFDITAKNLSLSPTAADSVAADNARLTGDLVLGKALDIRHLGLESGTITINRAKLTELSMKVTPVGNGLEIAASTKGDYQGPLSVTLKARADRAVLGPPNTITLESLDGTLAGQKIALSSPATLVLAENRTQVGPVRLTYNGAPIEAQALLTGKTGKAKVSAKQVDLGALALLTGGLKVQGKLSVDADVDLGPSPTGQFDIQVDHLVVEDTLDQEQVDFHAKGTLRDNRLNADLTVRTGAQEALSVNADLPVTRGDGPTSLQVDETKPLDVALKGNLDLGQVWPLTGAYEHILDGQATMNAHITGSVTSPTLNGTFTIAGLKYRSLSTGIKIESRDVRFTLDNNLLKLPSTAATDGKNGSITLSGWVKPLAPHGMEADIKVAFDKARVLNKRNMSAKATGSIEYVRKAHNAVLSGQATVNTAEYSLATSASDDIIKLNVKELHRPPGLIELPEKPKESKFSTRLKIDVQAQNQLFVRGRGLDSEWSGKVRVRGTLANPSLQGRIELVRGRFDFAGRKFELQDGSSIELVGGGDIDPVLNAHAVYSTSSLSAEIALTGRASNPQIKLSSNPELPQDEIISRVLFGEEKQNLTAFEAAQLGAAVASLSSSGSGLDVLGKLRNAFSLDRLTVGTRDTPGSTNDSGGGPVIRGGKYLTKNIYVEFGSATEEENATSASVDIDITKHLSVGTEATSTGNQKFKLQYKLDY